MILRFLGENVLTLVAHDLLGALIIHLHPLSWGDILWGISILWIKKVVNFVQEFFSLL